MRPSASQRIRDAVGFSADLVALAVVVVAVAPAVAGFLTGSLVLALALLCVLLTLATLFLIFRLRDASRDRRDLNYAYEQMWHWSIEVDETSRYENQVQPLSKPRKSLWMPDRRNIATFGMSDADFMQCKEATATQARSLLGGDEYPIRLNDITLRLGGLEPESYDSPVVRMQALDRSARKALIVTFRGSISAVTTDLIKEEFATPSAKPWSEPWVKDKKLLRLVRLSGARMEPFDGSVMIFWVSPSVAGPYGLWRLTFRSGRTEGDLNTVAIRTFALAGDNLVEIEGP